MSYSLASVRGATKAAIIAALSAAFDEKVLPQQPVHAHDKQAHLDGVQRQLDLLPEPGPDHEYSANMNGYLSWYRADATGQPQPSDFTSAGYGCGVSIVAKEAPKA
jgi:hypothetical protein